jgi:putative transposase
MTNHVHFIVVPEREDSMALLFGRANGRYAQALNIRKGRSGHLWQARYHSCVMANSHLWMGLRYVEENPCRAGMVKTPAEYRWSSAAAHLERKSDASRVLDMDFWAKAGGAATWAELHGTPSDAEQIAALRKCTYSGRPFGDESFVTTMEERFQRKWRRGSGGLVRELAISA